VRITAAAPQSMINYANQLAMVLAFGPDDGKTYGPAAWQDASGSLYSAASWEAPEEWVQAAQQPLVRPEWDTEPYKVNMAGAKRAQAALVFWSSDSEEPAPKANLGQLVAIGGLEGIEALQAMGLTLVENDNGDA
jgi:hypothetical protein